uniref:Putative gypsy nogag n=1 Tax=Amblyomma triste TaxID=251400 RepID=A0A023G6Z5_AMBTT
MFARYGVPLEVCTDNGPQFASHEFAAFARTYDFAHVTSSPRYPQSNGLAEKGVQVVKRIMKKCEHSQEDFWLGLLAYRCTPLEDGRSPGELLQGRCLRANLPDFGAVQTTVVKKHHQKSSGKPLPPLAEGSVVRIWDRTWSKKGTVVGTAAPRSYKVQTEDHRVFRRNRRHLLQTREKGAADTSDDDSDSSEREPDNPGQSARNISPGATIRTSADSPRQQSATDSPVLGGPGNHVPLALPGPTPVPRRSARTVKPPQRLQYDADFNQIA